MSHTPIILLANNANCKAVPVILSSGNKISTNRGLSTKQSGDPAIVFRDPGYRASAKLLPKFKMHLHRDTDIERCAPSTKIFWKHSDAKKNLAHLHWKTKVVHSPFKILKVGRSRSENSLRQVQGQQHKAHGQESLEFGQNNCEKWKIKSSAYQKQNLSH